MHRNQYTLLMLLLFCIGSTDVPGQTLISYNGREELAQKKSKNKKTLPLKDALQVLSEHYQVSFFYQADALEKEMVTYPPVEEMQVEDALESILSPLGMEFKELRKKYIVVYPKDFPGETLPAKKNPTEAKVRTVVQTPDKVIKGTVTEESGETLPGTSIMLKGTTIGTTTDLEGNYQINVPEDLENPVLVFSYIGYAPREVVIDNQTEVNIMLVNDLSSLEEVVVIGYGTAKKSDLTGAVSAIDGTKIAERRTTQVSQALQGAVPGLMVTRNNNAPGATSSIRIRGVTSIGNSNPLIIVDGVPFDNINDINPNDIENISVLKDAASSSIYGSRAAAGVILVTTKRGKSGQSNLEYSMEYGMERPTKLPSYVGPVRYMQVANEMAWNDNNNNDNEYPIYTQDLVDNYLGLNRENPDLYPITNWTDLVFNDYAPRQSHRLNYIGGSENLQTNASLAYDKVDALYDGRSYKRITARINNDVKINQFLSADINLFYKRTISEQPVDDPIYYARISAPIYAAEWSDGRVAGGKTGNNIYGQMLYGGFNNSWSNQLGGKLSLDITPVKGLVVTGVIAPTMNFDKGKVFLKKVPYYRWDDPSVLEGYLQGHVNTNLNESRDDNYRVTSQILANYSTNVGKHELSLLGGFENYYAFNENLGASRDQYQLDNYPYLDIGPLEYRDNYGNAIENAYRSFFGRVSYNYSNKYLIQANIRYDASSRFHKDYRWGAFPSFSAGWVMSEENFMKNTEIFSFLKIRASWGTLGNERIGNYPYQSTMGFSNALFYRGQEVVSAQTAAQWQYAIRDVSWETTQSSDIGLDVSFLDDRLYLSADYYHKKTKDMLLALEIPDYIGFDNPDQNTGQMSTEGWETEITWNDQMGDFSYSVSFNLSDSKTKMGDLGGTEFLGSQIKIEGSEFNEWYGYRSTGLFLSQEEIDNSAVLNTSVRPGDVKYQDISGPEGIPDGKITPEYDRVLLGGSLPRFIYGGNVKLNYKQFDFSLFVQGVGKQKAHLEQIMVRPLLENWANVPEIIDGNYWSVYNSDQQNAAARYPRLSEKSVSNNYAMSDFWLFDGAYFRLKNITLGYQLPQVLADKLKLAGFRLYGTVSDVFTINNYPQGWDPENGGDAYPITTSYVLGASIKF